MAAVEPAEPGPTRRDVVQDVLLPLFVQRAALFVVAAVAVATIPQTGPWQPLPSNIFVDGWLRFDSSFYLEIAYRGYAHPEPARFFPGYPWLIRAASLLMPAAYAAVLVANLATAAGCWLFYRFLRIVSDRDTARRSVWLLLVFPTSFFYSAAYSEGPFLLAVGLSLWGWAAKRSGWAALGVVLGVATRPVGVFCLTLPFLIEWALRERRLGAFPWFVVAAAAGVGLVLGTHALASGDPFAFVGSGFEAAHGAFVAQPGGSFSTLFGRPVGPVLVSRFVNWGALGLGLGAGAFLVRRGHIALGLMTVLSVAIPLAVQRTVFDAGSIGRYLLAGPGFAVALSLWLGERRTQLFAAASAMLQIALLVGFVSWIWLE